MVMVKNEEDVERFMLQHFPSCPLCKAKNGYNAPGRFVKNAVQCKSCGAQWVSNDFLILEELNFLKLRKTSRDGRGKPFKKKVYPIAFWLRCMHTKDYDEFLKRLEDEKNEIKEIGDLFHKLRTNDLEVRNEIRDRLREIGQPVYVEIGKMLNDERFYLEDAIRALYVLGILEDERGIDFLVQALQQGQHIKKDMNSSKQWDQSDYRMGAALSLGMVEQANKTGKTVEPLILALKNDAYPNVRAFIAINVFANPDFPVFAKDPRVIEALNQSLKDYEHTIAQDPGSMATALWGTGVGTSVSYFVGQALKKIQEK